jgi:hypothetical protein
MMNRTATTQKIPTLCRLILYCIIVVYRLMVVMEMTGLPGSQQADIQISLHFCLSPAKHEEKYYGIS